MKIFEKVVLLEKVSKIVLSSFFILVIGLGIYVLGYNRGYLAAKSGAEDYIKNFWKER